MQGNTHALLHAQSAIVTTILHALTTKNSICISESNYNSIQSICLNLELYIQSKDKPCTAASQR